MKYWKHATWLFFVALLYAVTRYNVFGDVAWENVPVYVVNKAISWTGLVLFGLSLAAREKSDRRHYGTLAVGAVFVHVVLSLMVLNPAYFGKFYTAAGRMNGAGELSMLAGGLGALLLGALYMANQQPHEESARSLRAGWGRLVVVCSAAHVFVMGIVGWLAPLTWPGYLPPISLISFVTAIYFWHARSRRTR